MQWKENNKLKQICFVSRKQNQEKSGTQEHSDGGLENSTPKHNSSFVSQIVVNKIHQKDQDVNWLVLFYYHPSAAFSSHMIWGK